MNYSTNNFIDNVGKLTAPFVSIMLVESDWQKIKNIMPNPTYEQIYTTANNINSIALTWQIKHLITTPTI